MLFKCWIKKLRIEISNPVSLVKKSEIRKGYEIMVITEYGSEKYKIRLEVLSTNGRGLNIFVTGGDTPHVGAVALAVPSANAATGETTCDINIITAYGHKDRFLAEKVADLVCRQTGEIVSVTAGVHVDNATGDDLRTLIANTMTAAENFLGDYLTESVNNTEEETE